MITRDHKNTLIITRSRTHGNTYLYEISYVNLEDFDF